jgi:Glycosyltransferase family 9 (heptosyltransferase)
MDIFIHHDGALGDVLLSLPVMRPLKEAGHRLHLAARSDVASFLRDSGAVDESSSSGSSRYAPLYGGNLPGPLAAFLGRFSRALIFSVRPDPVLAGPVRSVIAETQVIVTIPPSGIAVPVAEYRFSQLSCSAPPDSGPFLSIPQDCRDRASDILSRAGYDRVRPLIIVHPGSGGRLKCWPLESYLELITRLQLAMQAFVVILTGPAEDATCRDRIAEFARGRSAVLPLDDAPLMTAASLLVQGELFIGNDSGMGHLAAALGRSVLALFGPTDPVLWRPPGRKVAVVRAAPLAGLPVDVVYARVEELLCRSCTAVPGAGREELPPRCS